MLSDSFRTSAFKSAASICLVLILLAAVSSPVGQAEPRSGIRETEKKHDRGDFLPLHAIAGVIFTDGVGDVVVIGVERSEQCNAVREKGKQLGIGSLECKETLPIVPVATLRDNVRPLQGGLQIEFANKGRLFICTLGFNAERNGVQGFVVASHCTAKRSVVEGTTHYQPSPPGNVIGSEIADPAFFVCAFSKKCRYSDSAFDTVASGVTADLGLIERPGSVNTGSLTIAGSFRIVDEATGNAVAGVDVLNKVGRTTGWTQGSVTMSCVHTGVSGSNIVLLCQDFVNAGVAGGDSGSPVFKITDDQNTTDVEVVLYGILWGSSGGTTFVYSPITNIQRAGELGPLNTCALPVTC